MHKLAILIPKYFLASYPFPPPPPSFNVALHGFNPSNAASDEAFVSFGYKVRKKITYEMPTENWLIFNL